MLKKSLLPLVLACAALGAQAQSAPAPAAASGTKKDLVARILKGQQPGIELMARNLAEQPAVQMMDRAGLALNRVAPEKREAVAKEIQADVKKYADEAVPLVTGRAIKLAPATIGAVLEEKFSEDELRQVLAIIESPAYNKFQSLGSEMQRSLLDKLVADSRPAVEPKVKALEASIAKRLGLTPPPAAGAAPAPAKPASK